jgi:hypothetical protein
MKIIELILDEQNEFSGVEAISVVENPAIEEDFVALADQEIKLAEVDKEKRILMGALLVPNKPIYRRNGEEEYYVYFSKETIRKTAEMFLMKGNQNNSTLEHQLPLNGLSLVESWIVEDEDKDKSRVYDMNVPVGTWMGAVKVNNEEVWNDYVKTGRVKGFSIEGYFADKMPRPQESIEETLSKIEEEEADTLLSTIKAIIKGDKRVKGGKRTELESYSDYPSGVKNNAKRGIELNEKNNNKCATQVGKIRARQLAKGEPISVETIKRMYSYLSRAEEYYDESDTSACGTISYLLWGGKAGLRWSASKLKELGELELVSQVVNDQLAIIDDRLAYATKDLAAQASKDIGCGGYHEHEYEGKIWYMPCQEHNLKKPCQAGYEMIGMKEKNGRLVPNCVPIK